MHAALGMALAMINLGVFYIAQNADFLGIVQVFVYTGAVMMPFLFVLMLVGVDSSNSLVETPPGPTRACTVDYPRRTRSHLRHTSARLLMHPRTAMGTVGAAPPRQPLQT